MQSSRQDIAYDLDEVKQRILDRRLVFSGQLEPVMRRLLGEPDMVAFGTVRSVAAACGVSQTTVVRVATTTGYPGFRAMKAAFRQHIAGRVRSG